MLVDSLVLMNSFFEQKIPISDYDCRNSLRIVRLPGLVDIHVHVRDPGQEYKEDWDSCTSAALSGGITIIGAMPNTNPSIVDSDSFKLVKRIAESKARCDYGIFLGASKTNAKNVANFPESFALKIYLNDTFSDLKLDNMEQWRAHFENFPKDLPICCHAEGYHLSSVILLAYLTERRVHICHVSRKDEIEIIKKAKARGIQVTCEVTPHHLFLNENDIIKLGPNRSKVAPKLASEIDRQALWENMDVIDCFATDHAPHTLEEKDSNDSPPGFPGIETILPLLLTSVKEGRITLEDIINKMSVNPKRIFNIPEQPETYVEIDLDYNWQIPEYLPFSKSKWTPFAGKFVTGKIMRVMLRGETAFLDGKVLVSPGYGKDIRQVSNQVSQIFSSPTTPTKSISHKITTKIVPPTTVIKTGVGAENFPEGISPLRISSSLTKIITADIFASDDKSFYSKNIISVKQFTRENLHTIFATATEMKLIVNKSGHSDLLRGKVISTMFFEPSTRTQMSFLAAMERLGGSAIVLNEQTSSIQKGESFTDTIHTMESYTDAIVIRHPDVGSAILAAKISKKPIINAGDGIGEHPTQALLDIYTIREELGTVNGLIITLVGDLKNSRTAHSLVQLLSLYNVELNYISPPSLKMPKEIISKLNQKGVHQTEYTSLDPILTKTDVLYVTRIQKERFTNEEEYNKVKDSFFITPKILIYAKERMIIMHPLPRVNEISSDVDSDPRAAYFRQMENGMFIRMALLYLVLGKSG